jgi:putative membrane protein
MRGTHKSYNAIGDVAITRAPARDAVTFSPQAASNGRNIKPIMKPITLLIVACSAFAVTARAESKVSDAQIAAIVVAANQVDIDAGKFAADKTSSAEVKSFAQMMVTDHTSVNKSAVDLVTKLKISPEANDTSRSLKAGGEKNLAELGKLSGKGFDKAYVDHEVAYHEQVIQALDDVLVPNAQNAELKALLVKVRPAFIAHLEHAKHLQSSLK